MVVALFLRHFETKVEKDKPVSEWELDQAGQENMQKLIDSDKLENIHKILTSPEKKAKVTGIALSGKYSLPLEDHQTLVEVDRSRSGFIEGDFDKLVESYFKTGSGYEWEPMAAVEKRVKDFVKYALTENNRLLVISHGMVLSVMLSRYFNVDPYTFWKDYKFGQLNEIDLDELARKWEI